MQTFYETAPLHLQMQVKFQTIAEKNLIFQRQSSNIYSTPVTGRPQCSTYGSIDVSMTTWRRIEKYRSSSALAGTVTLRYDI